MDIVISDFNGADAYFASGGAPEWSSLKSALDGMPVFLQPSDQEGKQGRAIFDPKATNAYMHDALTGAPNSGWLKVPVPNDLKAFGLDWDGGRGETLAEWQFSNYPFLWNNVIRTEAVFKSQVPVGHLRRVEALIVVTKCGLFPASNSTLYFEQAQAQLFAVTKFKAFEIPIRLVGLSLPARCPTVDVQWTEYGGRYARQGGHRSLRKFRLSWFRREKYDYDCAEFAPHQSD
jgi:hypothetical protein